MSCKIGYQGSPFNYSHIALQEMCKKYKIKSDYQHYDTFDGLFTSDSDYVFFAIQNNSALLNDVFEKMTEHQFNICAEYFFGTSLNLVGNGELNDVKYIASVTHLTGICKKYLSQFNGKYQIINFDDSSKAVEFVSKSGKEYAAIAPQYTAKQYNLKVIASQIEDSNAITRFFLSTKLDSKMNEFNFKVQNEPFKSTFMIKITNTSGSLYNAIGTFSSRQINISQIESFPSARSNNYNSPWEHYFLLDVEGSLKDANVSKAVEHLKEFAYVTISGSYASLVYDQPLVSSVGV
eukprot:NODE_121_length_17861_cov_0.498480.p4 type:complete len:292 gc:universal NODE_121_length_17861_cov_0.498480:6408-7283(+)